MYAVDMTKTERRALIAAVRAARIALGMTQSELAEAAGVSLKTVNNMESGRTDGQDATVARMAHAVGLEESPVLDDSTQQLLAVLGPLIQQIPETRRATPVAQCVAILSDAIRRGPGRETARSEECARTSAPRLTVISDNAPEGWEEMPYAADADRPGDDPGEDD